MPPINVSLVELFKMASIHLTVFKQSASFETTGSYGCYAQPYARCNKGRSGIERYHILLVVMSALDQCIFGFPCLWGPDAWILRSMSMRWLSVPPGYYTISQIMQRCCHDGCIGFDSALYKFYTGCKVLQMPLLWRQWHAPAALPYREIRCWRMVEHHDDFSLYDPRVFKNHGTSLWYLWVRCSVLCVVLVTMILTKRQRIIEGPAAINLLAGGQCQPAV